MMPQPTPQQIDQAIKTTAARLQSKQLEIHSLSQLREAAPAFIGHLYQFRTPDAYKDFQDAVFNYLTAKMHWADLERADLESALGMLKQAASPIALAGRRPNFTNQK